MLDKVEYWLDLADEDVLAAKILLDGKRYLHAGFFCHLITEKAIKAVIASKTDEVPPKIHDLKALAKFSGISEDLTEEQFVLLETLNPFQIEARYPEYKSRIAAMLSFEKCERIFNDTEALLCWIKQRLGK